MALQAPSTGEKRPAPEEGDEPPQSPSQVAARRASCSAQQQSGESSEQSRAHKSRRTTPAPEQDPEPESAPESKPQPPSKPQSTCGVCNTNPPKYKCPRCYLPYCSVACNKLHRDTHPPDPEPKPQAPAPALADPPADPSSNENTTTTTTTTTNNSNNDNTNNSSNNNPFRALDSSEALRTLFRKYPKLPAQLMEIHAATQPPKEAPDKIIPASLMRGVTRKDGPGGGWNHDIGIRNGKAALRRAKKDAGEAGEAVREYAELILHVMSEAGSQRGDASSFLQQQAAREDTKLIQQLMAEEQRKR